MLIQCLLSEGCYVWEHRHSWPVLVEYSRGCSVDLAEGYCLEAASAFQSEREAADPREEVKQFEQLDVQVVALSRCRLLISFLLVIHRAVFHDLSDLCEAELPGLLVGSAFVDADGIACVLA